MTEETVISRNHTLIALCSLMIMVLSSCTGGNPPVTVTQHTDTSDVTAIVPYDGKVYCGTRGGLAVWDIENGTYEIITTAQGLSSNVITSLLVDDQNRLWVGSVEGISMFETGEWKQYSTSDGLPGIEINDLTLDGDNTLWVATSGGIARKSGSGFSPYKDDEWENDIPAEFVYFDRGGNMWIGTKESGLYLKTPEKWTHYNANSGLLGGSASNFIQTWDNSYWVAGWAGICRWDGFGWKAYRSSQTLKTFVLRDFGTTNDRLWYFTDNGVHASQGSDWVHYTEDDGLLTNDVMSGYVVTNDLVYVGTSNGLSVIKNGEIENYVVPNTHHGANCISIKHDSEGRIWTGTWETGMNLFDSGYWMRVMGPEEGMLNVVRSTVFGPEGLIVFNTNGGVVFNRNNEWRRFTRSDGITSDDVRCGVFDADGDYWIGTSTGVSRYHNGRWQRYRAIHGLPSGNVWACDMDSDGTIWFGTAKGIVSITGDGIVNHTDDLVGEEPDVRSVLAANGSVYFGTEDGRVLVYSDGNWDVLGNRFLDTNSGIYTMITEPGGALWLGSNGSGVIRIDGDKAYKYTVKHGLPSNYVRDLSYNDGVLWAACFGGIATIKIDE